MAKPWRKLVAPDFQLENPDWEPDRPSVNVSCQERIVNLTIADRRTVTEGDVALFKTALETWEDQVEKIAKATEKYLQRFLPGRAISSKELALWSLSLYGEERGTAFAFLFRVEGEFDDPSYDLQQFDHRSSVELHFPIVDGQLDWDNLSQNVVNDFD